MEGNPLVSVLMTAYNREKYIGEAIESVLASTYRNWELIIVDDCSKDDTLLIAGNYVNMDDRIKVYRNEKNLGDYPNRNKAASYAKGSYIMHVDSDDQVFPEAIEQVVVTMEKYADSNFGMFSPLRIDKPQKLDSRIAIRNHFFKEPFLMYGPVATIIRNEYFKQINGFPEKYGPANDMYFNLMAASNSSIIVFHNPIVNYRRHEGQEINNSFSYLYNNYLYLRDALVELELPINENEKRYLSKKNKRRFVVNLFKYLNKEKDFVRFKKVINITGFTFKDFLDGTFHWYSKRPIA